MANMTVIYKTPKNKEAFEKHYYNVHIPLAKQLPGLRKYIVNKGNIISPSGNEETFWIGNLYFDNLEAIKKAFDTDIGRQCAEDRKILAPDNGDVQIYLYDTVSV
ncbi:EthD family reductase [Mucilaginibacter arboris]|uniref:EthD family reductase n=1 Tax=Mucilaginibacter arboris TaxID=2682090 RepID=A0A7K1SYE1_9SPHI|nr:EthD family reductase [Mucilaginibacter arboris]MVN22331.1 EthD family reductase [Mucilaginibacter arboris]